MGLLPGEASHGNLQAYINSNNSSIDLLRRKKWYHQSAEAVAYIHSRGVMYSDLRPENFIVHETAPGSLELLLCDFGGAVCDDLGLDCNQLPNDPFYDPMQGFEVNPTLDIFSLGSTFYVIFSTRFVLPLGIL
jgi:serine/threonine protein kinase